MSNLMLDESRIICHKSIQVTFHPIINKETVAYYRLFIIRVFSRGILMSCV